MSRPALILKPLTNQEIAWAIIDENIEGGHSDDSLVALITDALTEATLRERKANVAILRNLSREWEKATKDKGCCDALLALSSAEKVIKDRE